jgi:hypothetical protein
MKNALSDELPEKVVELETVTPLVHLYRPGVRMRPPISPKGMRCQHPVERDIQSKKLTSAEVQKIRENATGSIIVGGLHVQDGGSEHGRSRAGIRGGEELPRDLSRLRKRAGGIKHGRKTS